MIKMVVKNVLCLILYIYVTIDNYPLKFKYPFGLYFFIFKYMFSDEDIENNL